MSYVGKILIVVQVVLSLLFMAFAGAVFSMHSNWKSKHDALQVQLNSSQTSAATAQDELVKAQREHESALSEATQKANAAQAKNTGLEASIATLQEQNNQYEQQKATLAGLSESKAQEARFRQAESEKQRIENAKLQVSVDKTAAELRAISDQLFSKEQEYLELTEKYDALLGDVAYLRRVVAANNLETNPNVVERMSVPPPPVEGLVLITKKNKTNNVQFVKISIGSDDGLVVSNELDVVRVSEGDGNSQWMGLVRVVDISPDSAVCEVVLPAKNGIIQEGDNVTTKL